MRRRARRNLLVVVAVLVCASIAGWLAMRDPPGRGDLAHAARRTPPGGDPTLAVVEKRPEADSDAPRPEAPDGTPAWWFTGRVEVVDPAVRNVRIEAHWWKESKAAESGKPDAVYDSGVLDLSSGTRDFRVEGRGDGVARLFVRTADGVVPAQPFIVNPLHAVRGRRGYGVGSIPVGTYVFMGRALDIQGRPVAGIRLQVRDGDSQWGVQHAVTDEQGRFRLVGFQGTWVQVSYRENSTYDHTAEYAGFREREVRIRPEETILTVHRNPRVRWRVHVSGYAGDVGCRMPSLGLAKVGEDGKVLGWGRRYPRGDSVFLTPGRWRLVAAFFGARPVTCETRVLHLDEEHAITLEPEFNGNVGLLMVAFGAAEGAACAAEARSSTTTDGYSGQRADAAGTRLLLPLPPDTYDVLGAVRVGEAVQLSGPTRVRIEAGDRQSVLLRTEPAAGLYVPAVPRALDGRQFLSLKERGFPGPGIVQGSPLRIAWLGNRNEPTTWWMPPGSYTLLRRDQGDRIVQSLEVEVEAAEVLRLSETAKGLAIVGDR